MRRFKAIYLAIILGVLWIGAGCAAYFLMLSPQMEKNKVAASKWEEAYKSLEDAKTTATSSAAAYPANAAKLIENYRSFHAIQATMPQIYDMKTFYSGKESEGLKQLYLAMGRGTWIHELKHWTNGYRLSKKPSYSFSGTLGYEPTLTSVKMIQVSFGLQTFTAAGYPDLINKVRGRYGYKHFPLIITGIASGASTSPAAGTTAPTGATNGTPAGGAAPTAPGSFTGDSTGMQPPAGGPGQPTSPAPDASGAAPTATPAATGGGDAGTLEITVNRDDPRFNPNRPILQMKFEAKGALITRGWDPNQESIASDIQSAKSWLAAPPAVPTVQDPSEFPKIMMFFGGRSDVK